MTKHGAYPGWFRHLVSYFTERIAERGESYYTNGLKVQYIYGKYVLDTHKVNYGFGLLDNVFRDSFRYMELERKNVQSVLLLGLGAGNIPQILEEYPGEYDITGVEIDPEVIRLGKKWFGLDRHPGLKIFEEDAKDFVESCEKQFDLIVVDLFIDDEIPAFAEDPAFFSTLTGLLKPGGMLLYNRLGHTDELLHHSLNFYEQIKQRLPRLRYFRAQRNVMLLYTAPSDE